MNNNDIESTIKETIKSYEEQKPFLEYFTKGVLTYFEKHLTLNSGSLPIIHSMKSRLKDSTHLEGKIKRKFERDGVVINSANLFDEINDLAGIRILHLHQKQFIKIHEVIMDAIQKKHWYFPKNENPKAYTWDPEAKNFYKELSIKCEIKESYYTSIHYIIMPQKKK